MAGTRTGRDEDALSEIVGFVLILALVVVASTLYLMYVVPAEGREDEIEHMNKVQDRFVSYKTSVDGLWLRSLGDLSVSGTRGVSLSTSFDLGTGGGNTQSTGLFLSFMRPIGTAARMRVTDSQQVDRLTLYLDGSDPADNFDNVQLGQLSYETDNYYWIQQRYEYSAGGIFLEQRGEGVSVKVAPSLSIYPVNRGTLEDPRVGLKLNLCLVNPTGEKALIGGTGPLRVETRLRENLDASIRNKAVDIITVRVDIRHNPDNSVNEEWKEAWRRVLNNAIPPKAGRFDPDDWFERTVDGKFVDETTNPEFLQITVKDHDDGDDTTHDLSLDLTRADLQVTFEYAED